MKAKRISITKKDKTNIQILVEAGLPENAARTFIYVLKAGEATSKDIESVTGLRQPEVSIAIKEMNRRGWLKKRDVKKEGKGRPLHFHTPRISLDRIIDELKSQNLNKIENIKSIITNLDRIKY